MNLTHTHKITNIGKTNGIPSSQRTPFSSKFSAIVVNFRFEPTALIQNNGLEMARAPYLRNTPNLIKTQDFTEHFGPLGLVYDINIGKLLCLFRELLFTFLVSS